MSAAQGGALEAVFEEAVRETIAGFEVDGSPVITDGEQRKPSFATYPIHGLTTLRAEGLAGSLRSPTAFAKIRARVQGNELASLALRV